MVKQEYTKLQEDFKTKWVAALRSGKYTQGAGKLKTSIGSNFVQHCCLGVACEVMGAKNIEGKRYISKGEGILLITKIPKDLIGSNPLTDKLADMNDSGDYSFKKIANWIEKNL